MYPVDIDREPGTCKVVYAKDQPEYLPLPALVTPDGEVTTRWRIEPRELPKLPLWRRLWLAWRGDEAGFDVYLTLLTFNDPLQPIRLRIRPR